MKSRFKFDTSFKTRGDLYYIRVSTDLFGTRHTVQRVLSLKQIEDANFDIIEYSIKNMEAEMEMHLAKISSS